jgi:DNA ligase-1
MQVYEISTQLFKRDTTGKVRVWWFETGTDGARWAWRANSGIQDGKIVTSEWKFVDEKNVGRANATTLETQASNEAHAEYNKKRDRGYFEKVTDVDTFEKFKPMLAHSFEDYILDYDQYVYVSQPKLDGIRCIARRDGLWSRAGKPIVAVPHIQQYLQVFFEKYPDAVLDGELYNHSLKDDFNKITSMVRKSKPSTEDIAESAQLVQYHIYDCVLPVNQDTVLYGSDPFFRDRHSWMWSQGFADPVHYVPTRTVYSAEQLDQLYGEYLEAGYEGQMVRLDAVYENKRSKYLLKRKEFITDEFRVVGVEEGKGNWSGYIKRFVLALPNGVEFGAGVRGNQEVLRKLFESDTKPDWATLRYFTPTPDGVPRFPVVVDWGYGLRED